MFTVVIQPPTLTTAACFRMRWRISKTKMMLMLSIHPLYIVGFILPAACLIATGYVNCNASLAVFLIIFAVGLSGISFAGFAVNHLDLAPPYAG